MKGITLLSSARLSAGPPSAAEEMRLPVASSSCAWPASLAISALLRGCARQPGTATDTGPSDLDTLRIQGLREHSARVGAVEGLPAADAANRATIPATRLEAVASPAWTERACEVASTFICHARLPL